MRLVTSSQSKSHIYAKLESFVGKVTLHIGETIHVSRYCVVKRLDDPHRRIAFHPQWRKKQSNEFALAN